MNGPKRMPGRRWNRTALEIRSNRHDEHEAHVFLCRLYANLSTGTYKKRTDIQRCTCMIWRDVILVQFNYHLHHFTECFNRQLRHHGSTACPLHALCVLIHAENTDNVIGTAESLYAFKALLTVMQTSGANMNREILRV